MYDEPDNDTDRRGGSPDGNRAITPEEVRWLMDHARQLRAEAMAACLRRGANRLARLIRRMAWAPRRRPSEGGVLPLAGAQPAQGHARADAGADQPERKHDGTCSRHAA